MTEEQEKIWRNRVYEGVKKKVLRYLGDEVFTKDEELREWANSIPVPPRDVFGGQIFRYIIMPGTMYTDIRVQYLWLKSEHELHELDLSMDMEDW